MSCRKNADRLVLRAQLGDRRGFDELLRGTQGWLYRYLCGLLGDDHLAEDVLQEVFVLIYRKLRWLNDPGHYRAWVYRIASREAFRHLRRRTDSPAELRCDPPQQDPQVAPDCWRDDYRDLVGRLSPNTRAVVVLHYTEGLSLAGVAAVLDLPDGTVKSRLSAGLAKLRKEVRGS